MKTIKQWLKEKLSEEDYKRAEKNENGKWSERWDWEAASFKEALLCAFTWELTSERWDWEAASFKEALLCAFTWELTKEGDKYWSKIYDNGGSL